MTRATLTAVFLAASVIAIGPSGAQDIAGPDPDSLTETYRSWTVRCGVPQNAPAGTPRTCEMVQELSRQSGGQQQRLLTVFVASEGDSGGQLTLISPLGLALPAGITISVGEQVSIQIAYATCRPVGCISSVRLDAELLAALVTGTTATVGVRTLDGQNVALEVSLDGFGAAWNRLQQL